MTDPGATARFLLEKGKIREARQVIDMIRPFADTVEGLSQIGGLYNQARDFQSSYEITQEMLAQDIGEHVKDQVRVNVVRNCILLNRIDEALENCRILEKHGAADQDIFMDMSVCYFILGDLASGEAILSRLLTEPRSELLDSKIRFNLGMYKMMQGEFQSGLRDFITYGHKSGLWKNHKMMDKRAWDGKITPGTTLLSCTNGGIGDDIVNVRFHEHMLERGITPVTYTSHPGLAPVFQRNGFQVLEDLTQADPDWQWCPNLAVPVHLGLDTLDLWRGPYLQPRRRRERLPGNLRIGIKCRGNPAYEHDLHRSLPVDEFMSAIPERFTVYSFHIDDDVEHPRAISLKDRIQDWEDTLDYVDQMDVIVSSCTSLVHAAGAMGKRTIVLSPRLNYYIWAASSSGGTSFWYDDNLTVLKQTHYSRWTEPIGDLARILDAEF